MGVYDDGTYDEHTKGHGQPWGTWFTRLLLKTGEYRIGSSPGWQWKEGDNTRGLGAY